MSQTKATRTVTVANPDGLHIRAASSIAKLTGQAPAKVELVKGDQRVDATNVLQIVSLCALEGEQLLLEATGRDAEAVLETLSELFENNFDENGLKPRRPARQPEQNPGQRGPSEAASDAGPPSG
jgi:phosphotransferase system HPr (HPr) family protein